MRSEYHQIELDEEWKETIFQDYQCLWTFQKEKIEEEAFYNLKEVLNVSDDIFVWGQTWPKLKDNVQKNWKKDLTLNKEKCQFSLDKILFFGMTVLKDGVLMSL